MTMTLINTTNITPGTTSVTLASIPQTFDDLYITASVRTDGWVMAYGQLKFNGATSGWTARTLYGSGQGGANSTTYADTGWLFRTPWASVTANTYNNIAIYVPNYRLSQYKTGSAENVTENDATTAFQEIHAWQWANNAAITSVTLGVDYGNFDYNCTISVYGITKGSGGATVS